MIRKLLLFACLFTGSLSFLHAQDTGPGIGFYPTGTEPGFGFRSSKNTRWAADIRVARLNLFTQPQSGGFVNEASLLYRAVLDERVRMHVGLGARADWSIAKGTDQRYGFVVPLGVEAFPFPFQYAGLIFEVGPYCTFGGQNANIGIRTVAGFVFYFKSKPRS